MTDSTEDLIALLQQATALATTLGLGAFLPKIGRGLRTLFTRGGVARKRDEAERLRARLEETRAELAKLRSRLPPLLDRNRVLRELAEQYRLQLIRAGVTPEGEYPPIDEDTDGP